jgi:hypothetical protein
MLEPTSVSKDPTASSNRKNMTKSRPSIAELAHVPITPSVLAEKFVATPAVVLTGSVLLIYAPSVERFYAVEENVSCIGVMIAKALPTLVVVVNAFRMSIHIAVHVNSMFTVMMPTMDPAMEAATIQTIIPTTELATRHKWRKPLSSCVCSRSENEIFIMSSRLCS